MEDEKIIGLYWARDEAAIPATAQRYGSYCTTIAHNILANDQDAEECVNDTWLRAWNGIPPQRPRRLAAFLGRITRNLALDSLSRRKTQKRGGGEGQLALEELGELVSGRDSPEEELDRRELVESINGFLGRLPWEKRWIFLRRYWYFDSVKELARATGRTENQVSVLLRRLRKELREQLEKEGFML